MIYAYTRCSTEDQAESGLGLEAQRTAITAECGRRGWTVDEFVVDPATSGGKPPGQRPAAGPMLRTIRSGDVVILAKLDRLCRSAKDFLELRDRAADEGWVLIALDPHVDMTTPTGKLVSTIMAGVAEWERDMIRQRIREALAALKARGKRLGRPSVLPVELKETVAGLRERHHSYADIADLLNSEEVPTARGAAKWWPSTVHAAYRSVLLDREAENTRTNRGSR